jgi:pimeloyl-ACP methyl ester carboxylesterase
MQKNLIKNHWFNKIFIGICLAFWLVGCSGSDGPAPAVVLVSATQLAEVTKATVDARLRDLPGANALTRHGVRVYRIVYRTRSTDNTEVEASGALLVPLTDSPKPLLSLQHATITQENQAPSNYTDQSEAWSFGTAMASIGFVVSAPDYLGFGASRAMPHPYEHAPTLASASLDMLRAVREFCQRENIVLNEKLFLAGYSLGGSATMALHKAIEEQAANEFTVTASAPGAGAYHKTGFARSIMGSNQALSFIDSYLWVLDTYNRVYRIGRPVNQIIASPFNFTIQNNQLTGNFSRNPQELFTPAFRQGILTGSDTQFANALRDNDIHDWRPRAPVRMFHGTADDFVPIANARDALAAMRARGATSVELQEIPGGNHFTAVPTYVLGMYFYFAPLL